MGFPLDFFPVLFAIPRVCGWLAHWSESLDEADAKIWRPRQVYTGHGRRAFVPLSERASVRQKDQKTEDYLLTTADRHPFSKRTRAAAWRQQPARL